MANVRYYTATFIGGPLDGLVEKIGCHPGINDGFWWVEHVTDHHIYTYRRLVKRHYADSGYVLYEVRPQRS